MLWKEGRERLLSGKKVIRELKLHLSFRTPIVIPSEAVADEGSIQN